MSSTNKTTNYNLSQYVGSDKPTYLGDYNGDMLKIDTQMKSNNTLATTANTAAGNAVDSATAALNKATSVELDLGDIESLVTTDKTSAVAAINEIELEVNSKADLLSYQYSSQTTAVTSSSTSGEELEITSITLNPGIYLINGICSGNANLSNETVQCIIYFGSTSTRLAGRLQSRAPMVLGGGITNWSLIRVNTETTVYLKSIVKDTYGIVGSMCAIKIANLPAS